MSRKTSVREDSPAYKAGIRHGDEIIEIDDIKLNSAWHARSLLVRTKPGETHALTFLHDGEVLTRQITLDALPVDRASTELHPKRGWLGAGFESAARAIGVIDRESTTHLELDDDIQRIGREDFDGVDGLAEWLNRDRGNLRSRADVTGQSALPTTTPWAWRRDLTKSPAVWNPSPQENESGTWTAPGTAVGGRDRDAAQPRFGR